MAKSRVLRFDEPEGVDRRAAEEFILCAEVAIRERGRFTVVLSGGSTPRRMLELLAAPLLRKRVEWSAVEFFWGDERAVPPDHSDSNYRMAVDALLGSLDLKPTQIHRMHGEREDADEAACAYQAEIAHVCGVDPDGEPPALDLIFLGMGGDCHTASLFPNTVALEHTRRWVVSNFVPKLDALRVTMTPTLINAASRVIFLVTGEEKVEALVAVLEGPYAPEERPSQFIAPDPGTLVWLVDRSAAAGLAPSEVEDDHSPISIISQMSSQVSSQMSSPMSREMSKEKTILAGDVGGTKTVIALYHAVDGHLELKHEEVFRSAAHDSLEEVLEKFWKQTPRKEIDAACFGVAGAVLDGVAKLTNLSWRIDAAKVARECELPTVHLLNDLEAMAYGMLGQDEELTILNPGDNSSRDGNIAVIAAGTGLGEALLIWDGERHRAVATEGGHGNFAPRNEDEIQLLRFLQEQYGGYVSYERILSGPGLFNIYRFLRQQSGEPEHAWLAERLQTEDPSGVIGSVGVEDRDPICARAVEMFASIYGSEAGNMALRCLAKGGVMLGGGIAPCLLPVLRRGGFIESFYDKGKFSDMMRRTRVVVATNPRTPLQGAAEFARASLERG